MVGVSFYFFKKIKYPFEVQLSMSIEVVHFQRKQRSTGNHSIESYFSAIRDLQPSDITITKKEVSFFSNGLLKRLCIVFETFFNQKQINHITGDIHFANLLLNKKNTILTIHDCGALKNLKGFKLKLIQFFWFTLPAKKASYITVNSETTKQDLLSYIKYPEEKVKVIYIFVPDIHQPQPKEFNKSKPIILQLGTASNKNIHRIAQALKGIPCKYQVVGSMSNDIVESLQQNNIDYEYIDRKLSDEEIATLYKNCDIVSFASTLEGFGMPIIEANATGRVVVTSNISSMPEIAGDAAELVNPFDVQSIRNGFLKVIEDDGYRASLIERGFENAQRFKKEKIAHQYFDLYRSINIA
jgi:glycosyltransferase involved in cell wall biosynthesis